MLLAASALKGYAIEASDGRVGTVTDLLFDDSSWNIRWIVVDTGTWLTARKVLLHPSAVTRPDYERQELSVALSRHQIEANPSIHQDQPVSQQAETSLYDYYGWDPHWGGTYFGGGGIAPPLSAPPYFGMSALREPMGCTGAGRRRSASAQRRGSHRIPHPRQRRRDRPRRELPDRGIRPGASAISSSTPATGGSAGTC